MARQTGNKGTNEWPGLPSFSLAAVPPSLPRPSFSSFSSSAGNVLLRADTPVRSLFFVLPASLPPSLSLCPERCPQLAPFPPPNQPTSSLKGNLGPPDTDVLPALNAFVKNMDSYPVEPFIVPGQQPRESPLHKDVGRLLRLLGPKLFHAVFGIPLPLEEYPTRQWGYEEWRYGHTHAQGPGQSHGVTIVRQDFISKTDGVDGFLLIYPKHMSPKDLQRNSVAEAALTSKDWQAGGNALVALFTRKERADKSQQIKLVQSTSVAILKALGTQLVLEYKKMKSREGGGPSTVGGGLPPALEAVKKYITANIKDLDLLQYGYYAFSTSLPGIKRFMDAALSAPRGVLCMATSSTHYTRGLPRTMATYDSGSCEMQSNGFFRMSIQLTTCQCPLGHVCTTRPAQGHGTDALAMLEDAESILVDVDFTQAQQHFTPAQRATMEARIRIAEEKKRLTSGPVTLEGRKTDQPLVKAESAATPPPGLVSGSGLLTLISQKKEIKLNTKTTTPFRPPPPPLAAAPTPPPPPSVAATPTPPPPPPVAAAPTPAVPKTTVAARPAKQPVKKTRAKPAVVTEAFFAGFLTSSNSRTDDDQASESSSGFTYYEEACNVSSNGSLSSSAAGQGEDTKDQKHTSSAMPSVKTSAVASDDAPKEGKRDVNQTLLAAPVQQATPVPLAVPATPAEASEIPEVAAPKSIPAVELNGAAALSSSMSRDLAAANNSAARCTTGVPADMKSTEQGAVTSPAEPGFTHAEHMKHETRVANIEDPSLPLLSPDALPLPFPFSDGVLGGNAIASARAGDGAEETRDATGFARDASRAAASCLQTPVAAQDADVAESRDIWVYDGSGAAPVPAGSSLVESRRPFSPPPAPAAASDALPSSLASLAMEDVSLPTAMSRDEASASAHDNWQVVEAIEDEAAPDGRYGVNTIINLMSGDAHFNTSKRLMEPLQLAEVYAATTTASAEVHTKAKEYVLPSSVVLSPPDLDAALEAPLPGVAQDGDDSLGLNESAGRDSNLIADQGSVPADRAARGETQQQTQTQTWKALQALSIEATSTSPFPPGQGSFDHISTGAVVEEAAAPSLSLVEAAPLKSDARKGDGLAWGDSRSMSYYYDSEERSHADPSEDAHWPRPSHLLDPAAGSGSGSAPGGTPWVSHEVFSSNWPHQANTVLNHQPFGAAVAVAEEAGCEHGWGISLDSKRGSANDPSYSLPDYSLPDFTQSESRMPQSKNSEALYMEGSGAMGSSSAPPPSKPEREEPAPLQLAVAPEPSRACEAAAPEEDPKQDQNLLEEARLLILDAAEKLGSYSGLTVGKVAWYASEVPEPPADNEPAIPPARRVKLAHEILEDDAADGSRWTENDSGAGGQAARATESSSRSSDSSRPLYLNVYLNLHGVGGAFFNAQTLADALGPSSRSKERTDSAAMPPPAPEEGAGALVSGPSQGEGDYHQQGQALQELAQQQELQRQTLLRVQRQYEHLLGMIQQQQAQIQQLSWTEDRPGGGGGGHLPSNTSRRMMELEADEYYAFQRFRQNAEMPPAQRKLIGGGFAQRPVFDVRDQSGPSNGGAFYGRHGHGGGGDGFYVGVDGMHLPRVMSGSSSSGVKGGHGSEEVPHPPCPHPRVLTSSFIPQTMDVAGVVGAPRMLSFPAAGTDQAGGPMDMSMSGMTMPLGSAFTGFGGMGVHRGMVPGRGGAVPHHRFL